MNVSLTLLIGAALVLLIGGLGVLVTLLSSSPPEDRPELGHRGLQRRRGLEESTLFRIFEPVIRVIAGWMKHLPIHDTRAKVSNSLKLAGDYLGLSADEFIALSLLCCVGMSALTLAMTNMVNLPLTFALAGPILGLALPWFRIGETANLRAVDVNRSLPAAIDLAAMCMGAGLDFPGSIRQIVEKASVKDQVLVEEFGRVLQEIELGHTRRRALESLAERVPTVPVKDFVHTVIQSEEKGTPLSEVLQIQAKVQRMRRSVAAEDIASKAATLMMGPMMMMMIVVLILLIAPIVLTFMK